MSGLGQTAVCGKCGAVYFVSGGHACGFTCPRHGARLTGGPVLFHCPHGHLGHGVTAADVAEARELVPA